MARHEIFFDPTELKCGIVTCGGLCPGLNNVVRDRRRRDLCTSDYCTRYMVGTRGKAEPRSPTNHVGFRCVKRVAGATVETRARG